MQTKHLTWGKAITELLSSSSKPLHYTDIAEQIITQQLKREVGATPAASVAAIISISLQNDGEESPFVRVGRGYYTLRQNVIGNVTPSPLDSEPQIDETGLINAFGMYWRRDNI